MIKLDHVTYTYPAAAAPALRDLSIEIPDGQFCAIIGTNGAGKSTLAYTMAGFVPHFYHGELQGKVTVDGLDTQGTPLNEMVIHTGLIFQNPFNQISGAKYTVREEIAFGLENLGMPRTKMLARIETAMEQVGITALAERSPLALSGGQMQRVAIASVLAMQPPVLILDEPTSQLDPIGSREVFNAVSSLSQSTGRTVVIIEHKLEWVATFADRVIAISAGRIVADGHPEKVLTDESLASFGIGQTRYTQAARLAQKQGFLRNTGALPVTLEQAIQVFQR